MRWGGDIIVSCLYPIPPHLVPVDDELGYVTTGTRLPANLGLMYIYEVSLATSCPYDEIHYVSAVPQLAQNLWLALTG